MLGMCFTPSNWFGPSFVGMSTPMLLNCIVRDFWSSVLNVIKLFPKVALKNVNPAKYTGSTFRIVLIGSLSFSASTVDKTVNGLPVSTRASMKPKQWRI